MPHELPDLPYACDALEPFVNEETMHLHRGDTVGGKEALNLAAARRITELGQQLSGGQESPEAHLEIAQLANSFYRSTAPVTYGPQLENVVAVDVGDGSDKQFWVMAHLCRAVECEAVSAQRIKWDRPGNASPPRAQAIDTQSLISPEDGRTFVIRSGSSSAAHPEPAPEPQREAPGPAAT